MRGGEMADVQIGEGTEIGGGKENGGKGGKPRTEGKRKL